MPVAPYGSLKYRAWNNARMRLRRENPALHRRERNLWSIHLANKMIARYEAQLNEPPHQEEA